MTLLRSVLFNLFFFTVTFLMTVTLATPARFVAPNRVLDIARLWARTILWGLWVICGIRLRVVGREHLPAGPALINRKSTRLNSSH